MMTYGKEVMITSLQPKTEIEEDSVVETLPDEDAVTFNEVDHEDDEMNADDEDGEEHDDYAAIAGENDSGFSGGTKGYNIDRPNFLLPMEHRRAFADFYGGARCSR